MKKGQHFQNFLVIILFAVTFLSPSELASAQDTCTDPTDSTKTIPCPSSGLNNNGDGNPTSPEPAPEESFRFRGVNEDYLNPANWNHGGTIPGPGENSRLDGLIAVIDPGDPAPIPLGSLFLRNQARLIIRDANLVFDILDSDGSTIEVYNSHIKAKTFIDPSDSTIPGFRINPSFIEAERVVFYKTSTLIQFGLGGMNPAGENAIGEGHYARVQGNAVDLNGQLQLFSIYGFHPKPGQTFEIITITGGLPANGTFANAPEGAIIDGFCDVQLRVTYAGGDGNDVVLTAEERTEPDPFCEEDFTDPTPEKNLFLDGIMVDVQPNQPIDAHNIQLIKGAEADFHDGFLQAEILNINDSTFKLFNSHLKTNIFIYTGSNVKPDGPGAGGPWGNPSFLEAECIVITGSGATIHLGLGGDQPAGENALGEGHYARMEGEDVQFGGLLETFFVYNFVPQEGQTFEIISTLGSLKGAFFNAPEGSFVSGYCDLGLSISYTGGDGNDVVLTAEKASDPDPNWACDMLSEEVVLQPEPNQEPVSSDEANTESASTETGVNPSLILAIAIVAVLFLLVVFLLRKRPSG